MKDPNDIDFTTLNWVKQELDDTLKQAVQALEAYVEDSGDKSQLRFCINYMHQVQGTLRMIELYGAAMVLEEMERVAQGLIDGDVKQTNEVLEVLMTGLVQLPDYLGRLQGGHRDIPIVLLPLLNDLRACRREKLLSETALFSPDLAANLPNSAAGAPAAMSEALLKSNASKFRLAYQFGLLKWIKGDDVAANLLRLIQILDRLRAMSVQVEARRLWWIASGVLEGVSLQALDASVAVKLLYGKVDREIKRVVDAGEVDFGHAPPIDLCKSLLYYAAQAKPIGPRLLELKQLYKLDALLPSQSEIEHAQSALSGRNRALLDTVGGAIKEDIMRVKDGLDMYLRSPSPSTSDLAPLGEMLQRVGDTLGVLGLGVPRKVVLEQRDSLTNMVVGRIAAEEQALLEVAGSLLFVESSLDDYIERLGQGQQQDSALKGLELPSTEVRRILDATMKEASVNLSQAKQDIVAFIEAPWDHSKIENIPKLLEEISGALRMLSMPEPAALNDAIAKFVETEFLRYKRVPTAEQLDLMADALASIEYYLEAIREARPNRDRILDVTRRSLEALGYWPAKDEKQLGVGGIDPNALEANEFVAFSDELTITRHDVAVQNVPLSLIEMQELPSIDIPTAAESALLETSVEVNLDGFVVSGETERAPEILTSFELAGEALTLADTEPGFSAPEVKLDDDSAFSDFDFSALDSVQAETPAIEIESTISEPAGFEVSDSFVVADISEPDLLEAFDLGLDEPQVQLPSADDSAFSDFDQSFLEPELDPQITSHSEFTFDALPEVEADSTNWAGVTTESLVAAADSAANAEFADDLAFDVSGQIDLQEAPKPAAELPRPFSSAGFQMVPSDDIDDEIREVFVEEVQDELIGLAKFYPAWKADQNDFEKLKPVRRSFHTLKGSGRLVGALAIGEFSWKVENMLNRALEKSIPTSPAMIACLDEAIAALPQLLAGLKGEGNPTANIGGIMHVADRVSAGEEIYLPKPEPVTSAVEANDASANSLTGSDELIVSPEISEKPPIDVTAHAEPNLTSLSAERPDLAVLDSEVGSEVLNDAGNSAVTQSSPVDFSEISQQYAQDPRASGSENPIPEAILSDPVLAEILIIEAQTHVATIRRHLEIMRGINEPAPVNEELLRAVHTLNGAISMVELPLVSQVFAPLEGMLKRMRGKGERIGAVEAGLLGEAADLVERSVNGIQIGSLAGLNSDDLAARVTVLRNRLPEPEMQSFYNQLIEDESLEPQLADQDEVESMGDDAVTGTLDLQSIHELSEDQPETSGENISEVFLDAVDEESALLEALAAVEEQAFQDGTDAFMDLSSLEAATDPLAAFDALQADADDSIELVAIADFGFLEADELPSNTVDGAHSRMLEELVRLEQQAFAPIDSPESTDDLLADLTFLDADEPIGASLGASDAREPGFDFAALQPEGFDDLMANVPASADSSEQAQVEVGFAELDLFSEVDVELALAESIDPLLELENAAALRAEGFDDLEANLPVSADSLDDAQVAVGFAELDLFAEIDGERDLVANIDPLTQVENTAASQPDSLDALAIILPVSADSLEEAQVEVGFAELDLFGEADAELDLAASIDPLPVLENTAVADFETVENSLLGSEFASFAAAQFSANQALEEIELANLNALLEGIPQDELVDLDLDSQLLDSVFELPADAFEADATPIFELIDADEQDAEPLESAFAERASTADGFVNPLEFAAEINVAESHKLAPNSVSPEPNLVSPEPSVTLGEMVNTNASDADNSADEAFVEAQLPRSLAFSGTILAIPPDLDPAGALELLDADPELLEIFVQEGTDILDTSDKLMARLRDTPDSKDIVIALQRELHTLKGGARMAGILPVGDLSHSMESLFEAIVENRASNSGVAMEALERSFDRLHQLVLRVGKNQAVGGAENVIARLDAVLDGKEQDFIVSFTASNEAASAVEAQAQPVVKAPEVRQVATKAPEPQPARAERKTALDEEENQRQQQDSIRVRADLIDNLVNYAGEVSIYRSRLEAQIGGFRFNLQEFDQTVLRLRDQLRKLEMETEAQILSRYQREEVKKDAGFDPLELDRFSTLQQLSRALAESVSDLVSLQGLMDDIARQSETLLLQQSRVSTELQEGLMRTRMVPFDSVVPRLRRIIRQTASELGKKAQLRIEGAQGEMDRTVMERMTAPLEHMLRNALAHGLERPDQRVSAGKSEEGNVTIEVSREATEVVIKVRDDGRGMDRDAIRRKAIERGLLRSDALLSDRDLFQFVLETGFSTAEVVSKVAGRGVGMDVVNSEIKQLGGSLQIDSIRGSGSLFTVRLPFTLSVTQAILIRLADTSFAIPLSSVAGVIRMPRKELDRRLAEGDLSLSYAGETYQIYDLGELIRQPIAHANDETQVPMIMTRTGDQRAAVRVSSVVGSKEIVVKSVGAQLSSVIGFFGATIMGDGSVIVILDLAPLVRHGAALRQAPELAQELELQLDEPVVPVRRQKLVMVVDDSITMRKVTTRVLERHDMEVVTAKDGLDAVERLQDCAPDLMLLDIEMPRMDGYELATYMKNDSRLRNIPIMMITSRTGDKHRQRAMEIGVERYLGKPYQETELLKNVTEMLNGRNA